MHELFYGEDNPIFHAQSYRGPRVLLSSCEKQQSEDSIPRVINGLVCVFDL